MEQRRKRVKLSSAEEVIDQARRSVKTTSLFDAPFGVWLSIWRDADFSAVLTTLQAIRTESKRKKKKERRFFDRLLNRYDIWQHWFRRDFPFVVRAAGMELPYWISEEKTEEARGSPWARYYIVTRIAVRAIRKRIISQAFRLSDRFPMFVMGRLKGLDQVHVVLQPKLLYKDVFQAKFMKRRVLEGSFNTFLFTFLRPEISSRLAPGFEGISPGLFDGGDPYVIYMFYLFELAKSTHGRDTYDTPHLQRMHDEFVKLEWADTDLRREDPVVSRVTYIWMNWYFEMHQKTRKDIPNPLDNEVGVGDPDDWDPASFYEINRFFFSVPIWDDLPENKEVIKQISLTGVKDATTGKLIIGDHMDFAEPEGFCQYCMKSTDLECENCGSFACCQDHRRRLCGLECDRRPKK